MNSKEETYSRPSRTYTLDVDGTIVKSKGLENFNGIFEVEYKRQHDMRLVTSSPENSSAGSWSSLQSADFALGYLEEEDDIQVADNLLHELDAMLEVDKIRGLETKSSFVLSGIASEKVTLTKKQREVSEEVEKVEVITKENIPKPESVNKEFLFPVPVAPSGLMAIRLPPIGQSKQLEDVFHKKLKEEDIFHPNDVVPNSVATIGRNDQNYKSQIGNGHSIANISWFSTTRLDQHSVHVTLPRQASDDIDQLETEEAKRITIIETGLEPDTRESRNIKKGKKNCFRKLFCGLRGSCGVEDEDYEQNTGFGFSEKTENDKKSRNCFKQIWRRLRKLL